MRYLNKKLWPFQIKIKYRIDKEHIDAWCDISAGKQFNEWYSFNECGNSKVTYAFKDQSTLLAFKLIWSNNGN